MDKEKGAPRRFFRRWERRLLNLSSALSQKWQILPKARLAFFLTHERNRSYLIIRGRTASAVARANIQMIAAKNRWLRDRALAEYPDSQVAKDPQRSGTQKLTGGWATFTFVTQLLF